MASSPLVLVENATRAPPTGLAVPTPQAAPHHERAEAGRGLEAGDSVPVLWREQEDHEAEVARRHGGTVACLHEVPGGPGREVAVGVGQAAAPGSGCSRMNAHAG